MHTYDLQEDVRTDDVIIKNPFVFFLTGGKFWTKI